MIPGLAVGGQLVLGLLQQPGPTEPWRLDAVGDSNLGRREAKQRLRGGDMQALKRTGRADLIVVSVDGGREFVDAPPGYYEECLRGLVDTGADLVLAHHPHAPQSVVRYKGVPIAPSLGSFVFLQDPPWTRRSGILRVAVAPDKRLRRSAIPVRVGWQPALATGAALDRVRDRLGIPLAPVRTP